MEYEKIKEWLDRLVDNYRESKILEEFNNQICLSGSADHIQIYKGIHMIADVMELELKMRKRNCSKYRYEYYFIYCDIEFIQLSKELVYAGAD